MPATGEKASTICNELTDEFYEGQLASWLTSGGFDCVQERIDHAYEQNRVIRDGYSKLANLYRRDKNYETALALFEKDRRLNRLTPAYRQILAFTLSKKGAVHEAIEEIQQAYLADPALSDGCLLVDTENGLPTFDVVDEDKLSNATNDKRGADYLIELAVSHAHNEVFEKATACVSEAYVKDPELLDGHARIGDVLNAFAQYDRALAYYQRDHEAGRLSAGKRVLYAKLLAQSGMFGEAEKEVHRAYTEDQVVRDGFAMIGSVFRIQGQFDAASEYFKKDQKLDRISPKQRHILADQLAREGCLDDASQEVNRGYQDDPSLMNGYARIGNILRVKGETESALDFYRLDSTERRLTLNHHCIYLELLLDRGIYGGAADEIKMILVRDASFKKSRLLPSWLRKMALHFAENGHIQQAMDIAGHLYAAFPEITDLFSRIAGIVQEISPLQAKACFERDWSTSRQTLRMTEKYLKCLLDNEFLDAAEVVLKSVREKEKTFRGEKEASYSYKNMKQHSRRLQTRTHSFRCPAILISFPRSGSNFIQNIVAESSGYAASSIYSETGRFCPSQNILVKSHAIDLTHLKFEMQATGIAFPPAKVIVLFRDPHDIMRSFLEYMNHRKEMEMPAKDFISSCSFCYAAQLKDWAVPKSYNQFTIADAYRKYVSCWTDNSNLPETEVLTISYENICLNPQDTFSSVAEFLELDCGLDESALSQKVALYSEENNRLRATAFAWKREGQGSHVLYKLVDEYFVDQIKALGYDTGPPSGEEKIGAVAETSCRAERSRE